jgi:putative tryptophan/tyrosine transport system substrate-binding protein
MGVTTLPFDCAKMLQFSVKGKETMRRREFIALTGASVAWPFAATAQESGRMYCLGCLLPLTRDAPINVAFLDEFRRRGFVEGQNLS